MNIDLEEIGTVDGFYAVEIKSKTFSDILEEANLDEDIFEELCLDYSIIDDVYNDAALTLCNLLLKETLPYSDGVDNLRVSIVQTTIDSFDIARQEVNRLCGFIEGIERGDNFCEEDEYEYLSGIVYAVKQIINHRDELNADAEFEILTGECPHDAGKVSIQFKHLVSVKGKKDMKSYIIEDDMRDTGDPEFCQWAKTNGYYEDGKGYTLALFFNTPYLEIESAMTR